MCLLNHTVPHNSRKYRGLVHTSGHTKPHSMIGLGQHPRQDDHPPLQPRLEGRQPPRVWEEEFLSLGKDSTLNLSVATAALELLSLTGLSHELVASPTLKGQKRNI